MSLLFPIYLLSIFNSIKNINGAKTVIKDLLFKDIFN